MQPSLRLIRGGRDGRGLTPEQVAQAVAALRWLQRQIWDDSQTWQREFLRWNSNVVPHEWDNPKSLSIGGCSLVLR